MAFCIPSRLTDPQVLLARAREPDMDGLVDLSFHPALWLGTLGNLALTDGHNIMLFSQTEPGIYQGHWLLRARGKDAFLAAADLLREFFLLTDARMVFGLVPAPRRASRWFTRQMGFVSNGLRETEDGPQECFSMTRQEFEARYGLFEIEKSREQL